MKKLSLKLFASFLAFVMLVSQLLPATASAFTNATAKEGGSFYFLAVSDSTLCANPIKVDYASGDTILDALKKTTNTFIIENDKVIAVNDVKGNYVYAMSQPVDGSLESLNSNPEILSGKLLVMSNENLTITNNLTLLVKELNRYESSVLAQKYIVAINLYNGIIGDIAKKLTIDGLVLDYYNALKKAIDDAEAQFDGQLYSVGNVLSHGLSLLDADKANVEFTNIYGSKFNAKAGESIQLLAGTYTFVASIPELGKKATGTFEVLAPTKNQENDLQESAQILKVSFPGDDYWLSGACFGVDDTTPTTKVNPIKGLELFVPVIDSSIATNLNTGIMWSNEALKYGSAYRAVTIKYEDTNSVAQNKTVSNSSGMDSASTALSNFIPKDGSGRKEKYIATLNDVDNAIVFTQEYELNLGRSPRTLSNLQVADKNGFAPISPVFASTTYNYFTTVLDTNTSLKIYPTAFSSYKNGYSVYVNDALVDEGGFAVVPLKAKGEVQDPIKVEIHHKDGLAGSTYIITPILVSAVQYAFTIPKGSNVVVENSVGESVLFSDSNTINEETDTYRFTLAEGQPYSYTVTQNTFYKTLGSIIAANGSKTVTVDINDHIDTFQMREKTTTDPYLNFDSDKKVPNKMSATIPDYSTAAMINVALKTGATGYVMSANYVSQTSNTNTSGIAKTINIKDKTNTNLTNFLRSSGASQSCDFVISKVVGSSS